MGAGGVTNCGTNATDARSLKKTGKPNSKVQRYNQKGELVQERWYDYLGRAIRNRDYSHSGEMPFPLAHGSAGSREAKVFPRPALRRWVVACSLQKS